MSSGWKTLAVHPFTINLLALEVSCCLVPRYSQVNARHTKVSLSVWLKTWMKWYSFKEGKSAVFHCSYILNGDQFFKNRLCSHLSKIFPSWVDPFWKSFLIQRSKQESKNFPICQNGQQAWRWSNGQEFVNMSNFVWGGRVWVGIYT